MPKESFHTTFPKTVFEKFKRECRNRNISIGSAISSLMNYSNAHHWLPQAESNKTDYLHYLKALITLSFDSEQAERLAKKEAALIFPDDNSFSDSSVSFATVCSRIIIQLSIRAILQHYRAIIRFSRHDLLYKKNLDYAFRWPGRTMLGIMYEMTTLSTHQFKMLAGLNPDLSYNKYYINLYVSLSRIRQRNALNKVHDRLYTIINKNYHTIKGGAPISSEKCIDWPRLLKSVYMHITKISIKQKRDLAEKDLHKGHIRPEVYPLMHMYNLDLRTADGQKDLIKSARNFSRKIIPKSESPYWRTCAQVLLERMTVSLMMNKNIVNKYYSANIMSHFQDGMLSPSMEKVLAIELYDSMQYIKVQDIERIFQKSSARETKPVLKSTSTVANTLNVFYAVNHDTLLSLCGAYSTGTIRCSLNMACSYLAGRYHGLIHQIRRKNQQSLQHKWDKISEEVML